MAALSQSLVAIPPILQVMLILLALYSRYNNLLTQFGSKQKDLASASINFVLDDAQFMDKFTLVRSQSKPSASDTPSCTPTAVHHHKQGREGVCTVHSLVDFLVNPCHSSVNVFKISIFFSVLDVLND